MTRLDFGIDLNRMLLEVILLFKINGWHVSLCRRQLRVYHAIKTDIDICALILLEILEA